MNILLFLTLKLDLLAKKMTARHVYFLVQGVQDFFPDPLMNKEKADKFCLFDRKYEYCRV